MNLAPLLAQLETRYGYPVLDADTYERFIADNGTVALFFSSDPAQYPESNDVAVILPELLKAFDGQLQAALIAKSMERELQARFRFTGWPSLVFLRDGGYLGVITGIRDWQGFRQEIAQILANTPGAPPAFDLDKVCKAAH